jgi:putative FmdB family regulatory protein
MPLYEYQCEACGQRFEKIQKFSDPNPEVCARCGKGPVERLLSSPAIQFKGTGWYITDYARKGGSGSDGGSSSSSSGSSSSSSSGSASSATTADSKGADPAPSTPAPAAKP